MITLKIELMPKNNLPLISDCRNYPLELCNRFMDKCTLDFSKKLTDARHDIITDDAQLFYCSSLYCSKYEKDGFFVRFKGNATFSITSSVYEVILFFSQQFFLSSNIKFGFAEFEVISLTISDEIDNNIKDNFKAVTPLPYNLNEILNLIENRKIV